MALYRQVYLSFWTDPKVDDDFTPEDKYFYLYLLTNPHTNICGCYEVSMKQMSLETGYNEDTINRLLKRMEETHDVIRYSRETKEVLIVRWSKYNWTKSSDLLTAVRSSANRIKSDSFRSFVSSLAEGVQTVPPRSSEGGGTSVTATATDTDADTVPKMETLGGSIGQGVVHLTDEQMDALIGKIGIEAFDDYVKRLSDYIITKDAHIKNHYETILKWYREDCKA